MGFLFAGIHKIAEVCFLFFRYVIPRKMFPFKGAMRKAVIMVVLKE